MTELMLHVSVKSIHNDDPHSCVQRCMYTRILAFDR